MSLRAEDYVRVSGIGNAVAVTATNNVSSHPTKIISLIPRAIAMRFCNTAAGLAFEDWIPYAQEHVYLLRTGPVPRQVFCEYQVYDVGTNPTSTETVLNPFSHYFLSGAEGWASYDYIAGPTNQFVPVTWLRTGGTDGRPCILTDASRWAIDTPETPDCVFVFTRRVPWCSDETTSENLDGTKVTFRVKGSSANAQGGTLHYGVQTDDGFWHRDAALTWSNDAWTLNEITIPALGTSVGWTKSFDPGLTGGSPDWAAITGQNIKFIGFSSEPTGAMMKERWLPGTP